ncbi:hypothetical protein ATY77_06985 [Rhizobium sp. R634]|nr:hypothetical protein ATY77_06985 [Rhizobium sp. R634]
MKRRPMAQQFLQLLLFRRTDPELAAMLRNIVLAWAGNTNLTIVHGLHGYSSWKENHQAADLFVSDV